MGRKSNIEEKIPETLAGDLNPKSRAKKIRIVFKKVNGLIKDKEALTDFKEPIVLLMRRSRAVEFCEDASKGDFEFTHSDGKPRTIYLEPSQQVSFDYGKRKFRGYVCHEDFPVPLPEIPIVTADTINAIVEKVGLDMKKVGLREKELALKTWKTLGILAIVAILILVLWQSGGLDKIINGIMHLFGVNPPMPESAGVISGNGTVQLDTVKSGAVLQK